VPTSIRSLATFKEDDHFSTSGTPIQPQLSAAHKYLTVYLAQEAPLVTVLLHRSTSTEIKRIVFQREHKLPCEPPFTRHPDDCIESADMDQREVETMIKSLQKSLAEKDSITDVITIMEKLRKEVVPTEDLLRVCSLVSAYTLRVSRGCIQSNAVVA
jgi:hypothetical protein